jgi:transposase InsO family protein
LDFGHDNFTVRECNEVDGFPYPEEGQFCGVISIDDESKALLDAEFAELEKELEQEINVIDADQWNKFEEELPPAAPPYAIPELCSARPSTSKCPTISLHEKEKAIPIYPKTDTWVKARSQTTLPVRWGSRPDPEKDYVVTPNDANVFSNNLLAGHVVVSGAIRFPQYLITNLRPSRPVEVPKTLPIGFAYPLAQNVCVVAKGRDNLPLFMPLRKCSRELQKDLLSVHQASLDVLEETETGAWHDPSFTTLNAGPSKKTKLSTDPDVKLPESNLTSDQQKLCDYYNVKEASLTDDEKMKLVRLLRDFEDIFPKHEYDIGTCNVETVHIDTGNARPISCNPYRLPFHLRQLHREELDGLLASSVIEESDSPWAAPCVYVPKKDGTWRLCMDFRKLNEVVKPCVYPLPRIEDIFDTLEGNKYFTAIDLAKGFWQLVLDEESRPKAAFTTIYGQFQYRRLPFGLSTSPGAFQKVMNSVLAGLNWIQCLVYLDDILVFSATFDAHLAALEKVFQRLRRADLKIKPKKCEWARTELHYLGHVINTKGKQPDPEKVRALAEIKAPQCVKDIECFLGKVGYYQKFIPEYSDKASPLNKLKRKNVEWHWGDKQQEAFEYLRDCLCKAPVLRHPDFTKPFVLQTDASGHGLGAVLTQHFDDGEHPIAYASRTLEDRETRHAIIEKEALAIAWGINYFRHYLLGREFLVQTDHKPLVALQRLKDQNLRMQKLALKLQGFRFKIEYRQGVKNQNADLLSRYPVVPLPSQVNKEQEKKGNPPPVTGGQKPKSKEAIQGMVNAATAFDQLGLADEPEGEVRDEIQGPSTRYEHQEIKWENLRQWQKEDDWFGKVIHFLKVGTLPEEENLAKMLHRVADEYLLDDEVLYRVNNNQCQICIPEQLRGDVLKQSHDVPASGHLGFKKTYQRLRARYFWLTMHKDLVEHIKFCPECVMNKPPRQIPREPLGELPLPNSVWQIVHMDIWTPGRAPPTKMGNNYVIAFVDSFSKFVVAYPIPNKSADTVAGIIVNDLFARYGPPEILVSDNAQEFVGAVLTRTLEVTGVARRLVTPHHPQANAQVERFFRPFRTILASLASKDARNWDLYVPHAVSAYNTSIHRSVENTPFFLMFGRDPDVQLPCSAPADPTLDGTPHEERLRIMMEARRHARTAIEATAAENRNLQGATARSIPYKVGDAVMLRRDNAGPTGIPRKLVPRYIGPFRITTVRDRTAVLRPVAPVGPRGLQERRVHFDQLRPCDETRFVEPPDVDLLFPEDVDPNLDAEVDLVQVTRQPKYVPYVPARSLTYCYYGTV